MRLSAEKLRNLCKQKKTSLGKVLQKAGVSKTAYYSLLYKDSVLPKSLEALAASLEVTPSLFLEEKNQEEQKILKLRKKVSVFLKANPGANVEDTWHTALLLQEKPIDRLKRSLIRAQKFNFYRKRS